MNFFKSFKQSILRFIYRKKSKVKFGNGCYLNKDNIFEGGNNIGHGSIIGSSYIGFGTYISSNCNLYFTKFGRYCAVGENVRTCLGLHPIEEYVSIHPAFYSLKKQSGFTFISEQKFQEHKFVNNSKYVVEIGNDVWIGNNVLILDGIKINDGAVISAGSIVTKDVSPYTVVGGIPAKPIKTRFIESEIDYLLAFQWWNKDFNWIKRNARLFLNIKTFIAHTK